MDNYEVVGLLGEGSFGRVYKAKQVSNSQFVALKVISKVSTSKFMAANSYICHTNFSEDVLQKN